MENSLSGLLPDEMLTDHIGIDVQHEEIFSRIEHLRSADLESNSEFVGSIVELLDYLALHFVTEERLAESAGIDFSAHADTHNQNLRLLNKALEEVKAGKMASRSFVRFIDHWFEHHINEFDKPFAEALERQSSPSLRRRVGSFTFV
ncbi:MAG: hemerythrin family protein [Zoogloeaceae bacterium]|nr:hemerythrin family protein [Zoogloeaceae bacterium]